MNREELEDLKITKISEEEYERLKDSDEGEAMEVSIDSLKAEQEKLKESASLLDEAKKAFSAYWFLLSPLYRTESMFGCCIVSNLFSMV